MGAALLSTVEATTAAAARGPASAPAQADANSLVLGLSKGLRILTLLNQRDDMSVAELSNETAIPRPTVHRILNTLMNEHLVTTGQKRGRYRVAVGACMLSRGYKEPSWLTDVAAPVMDRLQKRVIWPSDLATYSGGAMVIRRTTGHISPLSIVERHVGARRSVLWSALGLAYLAACPDAVCAKILEVLANSSHPESQLARDDKKVYRMLDRIRAQGFATRDGGAAPKSLAFAVPVLVDGAPAGALNVLLYRSATSIEKAEAEILPHLINGAADLGKRLAAAQADVSSL